MEEIEQAGTFKEDAYVVMIKTDQLTLQSTSFATSDSTPSAMRFDHKGDVTLKSPQNSPPGPFLILKMVPPDRFLHFLALTV